MIELTQMRPNLTKVVVGEYAVYFSYETPIAVTSYKLLMNGITYLSENVWSRTTGKHLNYLAKSLPTYQRISHDEFKQIINSI